MDAVIRLVLSEAEKINQIADEFDFHIGGLAPREKEYQSYDDGVRSELLNRLLFLGGSSSPEEAETRGAEIVKIIGALSHHYPFPERAWPRSSKESPPKPNEFHNIESVQKWRSDMFEITRKISVLMQWHKHTLLDSLKAYQEVEEARLKKMGPPEKTYAHESDGARKDFKHMVDKTAWVQKNMGGIPVDSFLQMLNKANKISSRLGTELSRYRILRRRLPSKNWFLFTIIFGSITFIAAVILPVFFESLPYVLWTWVPVLFYLYSIGILLVVTVGFYGSVKPFKPDG